MRPQINACMSFCFINLKKKIHYILNTINVGLLNKTIRISAALNAEKVH